MGYKRKTPLDPDVERDLEDFGSHLRTLRKAKGYTSYENFAFEHGLPRAQYGLYEKGTVDMRYSVLFRLARAHELTMGQLLSRVNPYEEQTTE